MDWAQIFAIINIILGGLVFILQMRLFRIYKTSRSIRVLLALIGLYWCGLYIFVALVEPGEIISAVEFGHVFVRPAFAFTLSVMVAMSIYRLKS